MKARNRPGRTEKKAPALNKVKGAPLSCPHCESVLISGMYLPIVDKTIVGCRQCRKLRLVLPGKAT